MDFVDLLIKDKIKKEIETHGVNRIVKSIDYFKKKNKRLYYDSLINLYEFYLWEILKENPDLH